MTPTLIFCPEVREAATNSTKVKIDNLKIKHKRNNYISEHRRFGKKLQTLLKTGSTRKRKFKVIQMRDIYTIYALIIKAASMSWHYKLYGLYMIAFCMSPHRSFC